MTYYTPEKQKRKDRLQKFLLSFFDNKPEHQEKEVNSFILVKNINGSTGKQYVSIFTKDSYMKAQNYLFQNRSKA